MFIEPDGGISAGGGSGAGHCARPGLPVLT
jgi:hypothetical protein